MTRSSVVDPHWFQYGSATSFYLNADPDTDPDLGRQTNADPVDPDPDPDPDQTFESQNIELLHERYRCLRKVIGKKKYTYECTKAFMKGRKPGLLVNFGQFPRSWIRTVN
jgi:hypothetical protein